MTNEEQILDQLRRYADTELDAGVARELREGGSAAMVLELLDELDQASSKFSRCAVEALPELRRRAGLADIVRWLDLGVALAESSGAATLRYFKESPMVLGLIEPADARRPVLELALDLAETDANVALDFLRNAPHLLSVLDPDQLGPWVEIGVDLAKVDYVVGVEFFKQIPAIVSVLPLDQVRAWVRLGMRLITENSLGKTDYLGTLEFIRTSPAILGEIEGHDPRALRGLVVSLGDQLAERDPRTAIEFLAESPTLLRRISSESWIKRVLQYGSLVAERDAEAALHYLRRCPEILAMAGDTAAAQPKFEEWFKSGMEVLELSVDGGRAYFALETRRALASVERAMSGVPLRRIARSLKLFVQGLCGVDVAIQPLPEAGGAVDESARAGKTKIDRPEVGPDGRTLALPSVLRHYPTQEENVRLYMVMSAHEAGHLEFGTYRLSMSDLADLVIEVTRRYGRGPSHPTLQSSAEPASERVKTLADFFRLYPQPGVIRDLWTVLEDARVEYLLQQEYPGLKNDLAVLSREAVTTRSLLHGMSVREMVVDTLLLLTTAEPGSVAIPDAIAEIVQRVWGMVQSLYRADATAGDTVRLADRVYAAMEAMLEPAGAREREDRDRSETDHGQGKDREQGIAPAASEELSGDYIPVTNWSYRGAMNPELIGAGQDAGSGDQPVDQQEDLAAIGERLASRLVDPGDRPAGKPRGQDPAGRERERTDLSMPDEAGPAFPDSASTDPVAVRDDRAARHDPGAPDARSFLYDEWDGTIQDYRSRWCRLVEQVVPEGASGFAEQVLREHGAAVRLVRRYFESIRPPGLKRMHGQPDGDELDLDAAIRRKSEQAAGVEPDDRIYVRRERRERDVAVAFLVDLSGSTSRQIESGGRRVIDVEKEGLVLLTEALQAIGDQYAVYGYSGKGREQVDFHILKDFDEPSRRAVLNRIGAVAPLRQNRDGAAIRHAVRKVLSRSAKVRLLILVSDGKPLDEGYAEEYSLEDTKVALREARMQGVQPFCITVDRAAGEYLRRMYGEVRYLIIDRIASLPERLPRVYQRLTA